MNFKKPINIYIVSASTRHIKIWGLKDITKEKQMSNVYSPNFPILSLNLPFCWDSPFFIQSLSTLFLWVWYKGWWPASRQDWIVYSYKKEEKKKNLTTTQEIADDYSYKFLQRNLPTVILHLHIQEQKNNY